MRDYLARSGKASWSPQDALEPMNGVPLTDPLTQMDLTPAGAAMQTVHPLETESGEPQAALSSGGFGTLRRAGRP